MKFAIPKFSPLAVLAVFLFTGTSPAQAGTGHISIPVVGCAADGMDGAASPPAAGLKSVVMTPEAASRLAFYRSAMNTFYVLAPRGWSCFGLYGSNGDILFVTPHPLENPMSGEIDGTGIEASVSDGDTSGRFEMAGKVARLFPNRQAFVKDVIKEVIGEGSASADDFPTGLHPGDHVRYRTPDIAEFSTPAGRAGSGTDSRLRKNDLPIDGVAIFDAKEPALFYLVVRLPPDIRADSAAIIRQFERDAGTVNADAYSGDTVRKP